ncbi:hypothetical protein BGZ92_001075 [Podila epicladia]|nr:hypothetical protein BGZ92_001075 [Podila epicladia]
MAQQKVSFKKWWKNITGTKTAKVGLFHIDLVDSIEYAGVPVNYTANGKTRCQGYIPTIVSKCGWLLKEQATKTRGIFRVSGSAKRVSELQLIFDTPPTYGSQLDWTGFTIHDASNVLRRYLNYLPDPVITLEYYEKFRDVYRNVTDDIKKIAAYQELISKLPPPHSCLLMYLLDLLSLFAHHSDENLMDSKNLASVFQPGVLSHPSHAMSPGEYMTSAAVLKFLIDNQSSFTLPQPNIDDDDEEMVNFGLAGAQPSRPNPLTFKSSHYHGGFVNAADHEKLYEQPGFEDELDTGIKRQLSLHKPINEHATLPGNTINRSKSTNSSISSRHSQSGKISSSFLARRRSNRGSKSSPKVYTEHDPHGSEDTKENDLSEISEDPGATDGNSLTPRSSVIRKATTSPIIGSDDPNSEFTIRRKQLKSEGLHREPSIFCETIEIPFPAPAGSSGDGPFRPSSALAPNMPRGGSQFAPPNRFASEPQLQYSPSAANALIPPTASRHVDPSVLQQQDNSYVPPPTTTKTGLGVKRSSATARKDPAQRPDQYMTIQRAKSNPGDLVSISARNQSHQMSTSHTGNHTYEMFKGWISGKNKDHDSTAKEKEKDKVKSEKKRDSLTEKQRKYKSQEVPSGHHQTGSGPGFRGPIHETISEHEYQRPPPNTPPQRPPPPPPESSLMDMLDPPQRLGYHSDHSSPTGSRSQQQQQQQ